MSGLEDGLPVVGQVVDLPRQEGLGFDWWLDPPGGQDLKFQMRGGLETTLVRKTNPATVEKVVDVWRQEETIVSIDLLAIG